MPRIGKGASRHASLPRLWWAALLSLAMLVGLPPDAEAQNSPAILQYKTSLTFSPVAAVDMTARCVGYTSQPLTVNSRVQGKPDNPSLHRFNAADVGDFELSKTAQLCVFETSRLMTPPGIGRLVPRQGTVARFEGVMQGNDKTPANLLNASTTALKAVSNAQGTPCQLARRPKANSMAMELYLPA